MADKKVDIHEFNLHDLPDSCTIIFIGVPGSGKTTAIEDVSYFLRHKYPVARVFMGTEGGYKRFCKIFGPLYVSNSYNEDQEKHHILRQKTCNMISSENKDRSKYAINIMDDVTDDPKIFKTPTMLGIFKLGSQHWSQIVMIGTQYAIDFPPVIRSSVSYVFIFRQPDVKERKKIWENFGGICGSFKDFCDLMDQLTGDYTAMVIKKRSQSNDLSDNVFWFKTILLEDDWKFGCKEYRRSNKERYNKDYTENLMM